MTARETNRISRTVLIVLSFIALLCVLSGYWQPPQADEGAAAHIFQLSVVALVPVTLIFLATADWKQPSRSARRLLIPGATLMVALAALYWLEHYR